MLKHTLLVLLVTASLVMAVVAVASAEGEVGGSGGEIGVGPTQLLANGTLESDLV